MVERPSPDLRGGCAAMRIPCMTKFSSRNQRVIPNGGKQRLVDNANFECVRWFIVTGRFRSPAWRTQGNEMRGSNDLREGGPDRSFLGFGAVR